MESKWKIFLILALSFSLLLIHGCGSVNTAIEDEEEVYVRPEKSIAIQKSEIHALYDGIKTSVLIDETACAKDTEIIIDYVTVTQPAVSHFGTAVWDNNRQAFYCQKTEQALYVYVYTKEAGKRISEPVDVLVESF